MTMSLDEELAEDFIAPRTYQAHVLSSAMKFAADGERVFLCWGVKEDRSCVCGDPACNSIGKHPYTKFAPNGCHSATSDPAIIKSWFQSNGTPLNVNLATDGNGLGGCAEGDDAGGEARTNIDLRGTGAGMDISAPEGVSSGVRSVHELDVFVARRASRPG